MTSAAARSAGWALLTGASLLVCLAALASAARPDAQAAPAARLVVSLPAPVIAVAAVASGLAALVAVAVALSQARRRRAEAEEEDDDARRLPAWLRPILSLLALLPYVLLAVYIARAGASLPDLLARLGFRLDASPLALPGTPEVPAAGSLLYTGAVSALLLLATLGSLALMLWLLLGDHLAAWWARPDAAPASAAAREASDDDGPDDLDTGLDARPVIIRCYRRFERALARARFPRAPALTPTEFMRQSLARLPLPAAAVATLTQLFERSRFSDEPLGPAEGTAALDALRAVEASLVAESTRVPER